MVCLGPLVEAGVVGVPYQAGAVEVVVPYQVKVEEEADQAYQVEVVVGVGQAFQVKVEAGEVDQASQAGVEEVGVLAYRAVVEEVGVLPCLHGLGEEEEEEEVGQLQKVREVQVEVGAIQLLALGQLL